MQRKHLIGSVAVALIALVTLACNGTGPVSSTDGSSAQPVAPGAPGAGGADNAPAPPANGHRYACGITLHAPKVNWDMGFPTIEVSTTADCDPPPPSVHVVTVFAYHYEAGKWVKKYGLDGAPGGVCKDIPGAGGPKDCHWYLRPCIDGVWQTRAQVHWVGPAPEFRTGPDFNPPETPQAELSCANPN